MRSFDERQDFKTLLLADADVARTLSHDELSRAFDLEEQFRHVDYVFDRVFAPPASADRPLFAELPGAVGAQRLSG
jgi:hypothetical protein